MASKNKTNVPLDPTYDYEDPAVSWINLIVATRELNHDRRQQMINQLLFTAKNSHWTHELWDQVMSELETPEHEVLDVDSDDDAAADVLSNVRLERNNRERPEHHSYRSEDEAPTQPYEDSQWDQ